jgi:hypothetical protein
MHAAELNGMVCPYTGRYVRKINKEWTGFGGRQAMMRLLPGHEKNNHFRKYSERPDNRGKKIG